MALLTVQKIVEAGLTPSFVAAAVGGDTADNSDGKTFIHVKNGGGGSINVTITAAAGVSPVADPKLGTLTKANIVKSVAAGAEAIIGPLKKQAFNNSSQQLSITYSGVTSVTVAALKIEY